MFGTSIKGLVPLLRQVLLLTIAALLIMLSELPIQAPAYGQIAANVGLAIVFYWSAYRPELIPPVTALVLGLWQDVLAGTLIGSNALVFLVVRQIIVSQVLFFRSRTFTVVWCCFAPVALASAVFDWLSMTVMTFSVISPYPALFHAALTAGMFPFVAWFLNRIEQPVLSLNVPR